MIRDERYTLRTVADDPALAGAIQTLIERAWPAYIQETSAAGIYTELDWIGVYTRWPGFQFGIFDAVDDRLVAGGNAAPLAYAGALADLPDEGWDWALHTATTQADAGIAPTLLCALSITVEPAAQGRGLSGVMARTMRGLAAAAGFGHLIAPVRPTLKPRYPLIPIQSYLGWTTADGLPFDPWLRTHVRAGGVILKACPRSMSLQGTVAGWERWTGLAMPGSGHYVVPELLTPLQVNRDADRGLYIEPNVWVAHTLHEGE